MLEYKHLIGLGGDAGLKVSYSPISQVLFPTKWQNQRKHHVGNHRAYPVETYGIFESTQFKRSVCAFLLCPFLAVSLITCLYSFVKTHEAPCSPDATFYPNFVRREGCTTTRSILPTYYRTSILLSTSTYYTNQHHQQQQRSKMNNHSMNNFMTAQAPMSSMMAPPGSAGSSGQTGGAAGSNNSLANLQSMAGNNNNNNNGGMGGGGGGAAGLPNDLDQLQQAYNRTGDRGSQHHPIAEFLYQLTKMLTDDNSEIIEWVDGRIKVHYPERLEGEVLHKYFRHSKFASFQRKSVVFWFGFVVCWCCLDGGVSTLLPF